MHTTACHVSPARYFKLSLALLSLLALPACAGNFQKSPNLLADAYGTPGIVHIPPYTRTIFSTTDF